MHRSSLGRTALVPGLALAATLVGCLGTGSPFDAGAASGAEAWSPDAIGRAEIVERGKSDHTAMALIRRLRPGWLRPRGQKSLTDPTARYPVVYIDDVRHGGLPTLHRIPAGEILRMEFVSMADATTRWGTGHPSGVINVLTGR